MKRSASTFFYRFTLIQADTSRDSSKIVNCPELIRENEKAGKTFQFANKLKPDLKIEKQQQSSASCCCHLLLENEILLISPQCTSRLIPWALCATFTFHRDTTI